MNVHCKAAAILWLIGISIAQDNWQELQRKSQNTVWEKEIVVSTILEAPYMMMKPPPWSLPKNRYEGYLTDIIEKLAAAVGFSYKILLARDGLVGSEMGDGSWTGVIGEVSRKEVDIGAAALVITHKRSKVISFSEPFLSLRSSILIRKSGRPTKKQQRHNKPTLSVSKYTLANVTKINWKSQSKTTKRITSLDQLLMTNYTIGIVRRSASEAALQSSKDLLHQSIWRRINENKSSSVVDNLQEGLDRVKRGRFALILESPMAEYQATRLPCEFYASEPFLDVLHYSFALQPGNESAEFRKAFDKELANLKAGDEMQTLYLKWWKDQCYGSHLSDAEEYSESELNRRYADPFERVISSSKSDRLLTHVSRCFCAWLAVIVLEIFRF